MTSISRGRRWISQAEAAEYLGVTDRSIRNYVRYGSFKAYRIPKSRLIRFDRGEIDAALLANQVPSAEFDEPDDDTLLDDEVSA